MSLAPPPEADAPLRRLLRDPLRAWRGVDETIVFACLLLAGFGLILLISAGQAVTDGADPFGLAGRQAVFLVAAAGIAAILAATPVKWVRRIALAGFVGLFACLSLVLLIGDETKGASRWLVISGFRFQPSEQMKPVLVVVAAWLLAQRDLEARPGRSRPGEGPWTLAAFAFYAPTAGLILLQPDVGQTALLTVGFLTAFFVSGLPLAWGLFFGVGGIGLAILLYNLLGYVRRRIDAFFNPSAHDTYQTDKAIEALQRGGLFGQGLGEGQIKEHLPEAHNDFIFAVAVEEFGAIGGLLLIGLVAFIALRGLTVAARLPDPFARSAACGLYAMFGVQAFINIAVNVGVLPPKGMTLPLISAGGSSLLGMALTLGFALALTRKTGEAPR